MSEKTLSNSIGKEKKGIQYLFFLMMTIYFLCLIEEIRKGQISFSWLFRVGLSFFALHIMYQSLKRLLYTYWTVSFCFLCFFSIQLLISFFVNYDSSLFIFYFTALVILIVQMFLLYSPVYYPRVRWWEYDFRYRHDLKINLEWDQIIVPARLTDLRREAGCVLCFEHIPIGSFVTVRYQAPSEVDQMHLDYFNVKALIVSKKEYSFGRAISYGVKFQMDVDNKDELSQFMSLWRQEQKKKISYKNNDLR